MIDASCSYHQRNGDPPLSWPYLYHKHVHPIHPTNLMEWINQHVPGDYRERITLVQSCSQGTVNQIDICGTRTQCLHLHCWFTPYRSIIHRCSIHQEIPREVLYTEWRWNGWICEMADTGTVLYTHVLQNVYKYIIYLCIRMDPNGICLEMYTFI